jgi:flagellar hook-basal body complex protein FliE
VPTPTWPVSPDPAAGLGKAAGAAGEAAGGPSFGALLKDALNSVAESGHRSDAQTRSMVAGKADMVDVVTAVSETAAMPFSNPLTLPRNFPHLPKMPV